MDGADTEGCGNTEEVFHVVRGEGNSEGFLEGRSDLIDEG